MIKLEGPIEGRPNDTAVGTWRIAGRWVSVLDGSVVVADTEPPRLGANAVVIGNELTDGTIHAVLVHVTEPTGEGVKAESLGHSGESQPSVAWGGVIESIDGELWSVGGHRVTVATERADHRLAGATVGDIVEVWAMPDGSGRLVAKEVHVVRQRGHGWPVELVGRLRSIAPTLLGWWLVEHERVLVTESAVLGVHPREGDDVTVFGREYTNGVIVADVIVTDREEQIPFPRMRPCVLPPYLSAS